MSLVTVNKNAKTKRYYHYYAQGLAELPQKYKNILANIKIHTEGGLSIHNRNAVLTAGTVCPSETGIYYLSEGGMLVASNLITPNFTGEMLDWWFPWQVLEPLRYAIWDPEDHVDNQVSESDRAHLLDPAIPVREKIWGTTFHALELMGDSLAKTDISFHNPAVLGYKNDSCDFIIAANALLGEKKIPVTMLEVAKKINGVMNLQLRFWIGYHIIDGLGTYLLPQGIKVPAEAGINLIHHNFREFNNLHLVLPTLYAEEKDNWN